MFTCQTSRRFAPHALLALYVAIVSHPALAETPATPQPKFNIQPFAALREALDLLPAKDRKIVSADELELFRKVAAGEKDKISLSDATLTIAGVSNDTDRERYLARLDEIAAGAREAIADCKTPQEKAATLADYLFKNCCTGGFVHAQVDIRRLLDRGEFNCVSSSILYNNIASRFGRKTRRVIAPGHVFLRMGDLVIEPVAGKTHTLAEQQKYINKLAAKASANIRNQYDETHTYMSGNLGLIGEPYITRGGDEESRNRLDLATINTLEVACLDPGNPANAYSLESELKGWFKTTLKNRQFDKAQKLAAIYGQLFGDASNDLFAQVTAARAGRAAKS
jgi:hypothetical protein